MPARVGGDPIIPFQRVLMKGKQLHCLPASSSQMIALGDPSNVATYTVSSGPVL